jgi:glycerol-3-phosphate dehydrogenase subunit B
MMVKKADVLVIGAGLSGLVAAAAASRGQKVILAAAGMGVTGLSSGCIDLWGYSPDRPDRVSKNPLEDIAGMVRSRPDHPYARAVDVLGDSIRFFIDVTSEMGCRYMKNGPGNWLVPTALGTLRPTCLAPASMAVGRLADFNKIVVVGFAELKDFHPRVMAANLARNAGLPEDFCIEPVTVDTGGGESGPDALARRLERPDILQGVVNRLKPFISPGAVALFAPVLGERWDSAVPGALAGQLGCPVYEAAGIPPSLPGLRLQRALLGHLRKSGVEVITGCRIEGCSVAGRRCLAVSARGGLQLSAETFILATGSFLGGGLQAAPARVWETVFGLPVRTGTGHWAERDFLNPGGHPFSKFGIEVNQRLQPLDEKGRVLLDNVMVVGSNLAGCNYPVEKCGNGVALATGYKAGRLAGRCS